MRVDLLLTRYWLLHSVCHSSQLADILERNGFVNSVFWVLSQYSEFEKLESGLFNVLISRDVHHDPNVLGGQDLARHPYLRSSAWRSTHADSNWRFSVKMACMLQDAE